MPVQRSATLTIAIVANDDLLETAHKEASRFVYSPWYAGPNAVARLLVLHGRQATLYFPDGTTTLTAELIRGALQHWADNDATAKPLNLKVTANFEESVARPGQPIWQPPAANKVGFSYRLAWADDSPTLDVMTFTAGDRTVLWFLSAEVSTA